jgi:hypothetical protein
MRDYEDRLRLGVRHIDHPKIPPGARPAQRNPGSLATRSILKRTREDVTDLILADTVSRDVRFA